MVNILTKLNNENVKNIWALIKTLKTDSLYKGNMDVDCEEYTFQRNKYVATSMDKLGMISVDEFLSSNNFVCITKVK